MNADREAVHLEAQEVAAFIDGGLSATDQERVIAHLADCSICRVEVIAVKATLAAEKKRLLPPGWMVAAAAAAIAGIVFLGPMLMPRTPGDAPVFRADDTASASTIETVSPGDTVFTRADLQFAWRSSGPDATYRVSVTGTDGEMIWTEQLRDTVAVPDVNLEAGTYLWLVEALMPDGPPLTSRTRRFVLVE